VATHRLLSDAFIEAHPTEAAAALETMPAAETAAYLAQTSARLAATVLERMVAVIAGQCLLSIPVEKAVAVLERLDVYSAASILRTVEPAIRKPLLDAADDDVAVPLRLMLTYPEGSAGALMDPRVKVMPADVTVREAIARVRKSPGRILFYLYIVDRDGTLVGVLNLRELMLAPATQQVGVVARRGVARIAPGASAATIVAHPRWRDVHALPVADDSGRLLGAIRYGTFRRLEEEAALERRRRHPATLMIALVQLYWLAFAALLPALTSIVVRVLESASEQERS
jgi:magnesium transporter